MVCKQTKPKQNKNAGESNKLEWSRSVLVTRAFNANYVWIANGLQGDFNFVGYNLIHGQHLAFTYNCEGS